MAEVGRVSSRSFDMKLGFLSKSRSRSVVRSRSVIMDIFAPPSEHSNGLKNSVWANLPPELLREILVRLEESDKDWPKRRNVVACAGVCKTWREIMKEVVRVPEISGKLTFPISVKQPGPREPLLQCFIRRNRSTQTYRLYLNLTQALADEGKFVLAAHKFRRPTCTDYNISLHTEDFSKGSSMYIGKLRSNFLGTKFIVYDGVAPHSEAKITKSRSIKMAGLKQVSHKVPAENYPVAHISYELNALGSRCPRRMDCVLNDIPASCIKPGGVAPTQTDLPLYGSEPFISLPFLRSKSTRHENFLDGHVNDQRYACLALKNKSPRWHEQLQCWCLNFHGRVTVASVKNFQLVASLDTSPQDEKVILQFGKVGKDVFTMDYRFPLSAFQAFAICLSSFDTRIACE